MKSCYKKTFPILVIIGVVSIWLSSCAYFNTYYNAKYYFKEGQKENENNNTGRPQTANYQKSINSAARVIEYYPDSKYVDDAIIMMGKAYYEIRSYPKAKRKCEELITNYPESPLVYEARLYLGKTLIGMRKPEEGIAILNDLWIDEGVPMEMRIKSQTTQADYYFEKENYRQALKEYEKILGSLKDKRERADIRYQIGECYFELGELEQAHAAYERVLSEKPGTKTRFDSIYKRAKCLEKLGDLEDALKIDEKLLKKDIFYDFYDKAYLAKAGILAALERREEAVELYERILELYPRTLVSAEASYHVGQIYWQYLKDFDKAQEHLGKVQSESSQSEFIEEANAKVTDLRVLQALHRSIDSLNTDLDTLAIHLEWLAEAVLEIEPDSLQSDSAAALQADSISAGEVTPVPGEPVRLMPGTTEPMPPSELTLPGGKTTPGRPGMPGYESRRYPSPTPSPGSMASQPIVIPPLPDDSASVYARMDSDYVELAEVRFRLGEHLWTQFGEIDSAKTIFIDLTTQTYNPDVEARSLLSLYHLAAVSSPDSVGPDSLLWQINQDIPDSEYDRWVRNMLGLDPLPEPVDTVAELYRIAEELWLTDSLPGAAIEKYREVTAAWPDTDWGAKALYVTAWLQENKMSDIDGATASYDSLIAWYPESEYVVIAQNKLAPPPPEVPDSLEAVEDSIAAIEPGEALGTAPPGSGPVELIGGQSTLLSYIHQNHLYPLVASEAEISGEVLVSFIVDAEGVPRDFEIQREDPDGFDFGESAIQALQGMRFRPAYSGGQYIESPTTQIVRFEP